ncbi:RHS repeat-associated core domain-containing protein [Paracidovorax avenae]|uniref:RHS repeat-associated core domain-containing protein n=1 Tax=Paracidovorax avenae TaxID=80867 RepID=UPI001CEF66BC|nr:RHS repeat-associated core domain-containing protein [Paracidovorax avenae]
MAQQTASASAPSTRIYYFHLQPNGLPEEMSDRNGQVVWRAQYRVWGSAVAEGWQAFDAAGRPVDTSMAEMGIQTQAGASPMPQNLRMQGQYLDRETGLHYNTFRYYDADLGAFTTPDPIGLAGGVNLHQYAFNPVIWTDPWGWSPCPSHISQQKQAGHVLGTPQQINRAKINKPTSVFVDWSDAVKYTDEAWAKGTPVPGRPGLKDHEFHHPVGFGPNGGTQSKVRVHQDANGKIHGHPAGPETP